MSINNTIFKNIIINELSSNDSIDSELLKKYNDAPLDKLILVKKSFLEFILGIFICDFNVYKAEFESDILK